MEYPKYRSLSILAGNSENPGKCVGFEQITVNATAKPLNTSVCSQTPRYAILTLESDATGVAVRYLLTGAVPTTTVGMPKSNLSSWDVISTQDMVRFRIIQAQAGTHTLNVEYYV